MITLRIKADEAIKLRKQLRDMGCEVEWLELPNDQEPAAWLHIDTVSNRASLLTQIENRVSRTQFYLDKLPF